MGVYRKVIQKQFNKATLILLSFVIVTLCSQRNITLAEEASVIKVVLNGNEILFEEPPVIENGVTLVPFRAMFEALNLRVSWDPTTQIVKGNKEKFEVELTLGRKTGYVNGKAQELEVEPRIIHDSTFIPLGFVSEAMGARVQWDGDSNTVHIDTANKQSVSNEAREVKEVKVVKDRAKQVEDYLTENYSIVLFRGNEYQFSYLAASSSSSADGIIILISMKDAEQVKKLTTSQSQDDTTMRSLLMSLAYEVHQHYDGDLFMSLTTSIITRTPPGSNDKNYHHLSNGSYFVSKNLYRGLFFFSLNEMYFVYEDSNGTMQERRGAITE